MKKEFSKKKKKKKKQKQKNPKKNNGSWKWKFTILPNGIYAQTRICPGKWDALNSLRFWDTNRSPNPI